MPGSFKIFYNGNIITMETPLHAEAVYVANGKIISVGAFNELVKNKTAQTQMIDLQGKTLMPGFIDSHSHISAFANSLCYVSLSDAKCFDDIVKKMQDYKNRIGLNDNQWIIGFGYDHNQLAERTHPDKNLLDKISASNPILISHISGHRGVVNTSGLNQLHITKETPAPRRGIIGHFVDTGEPNGYLEENAFSDISSKIPEPSEEQLMALMEKAQKIYLQYGITTAQEGRVNKKELDILKNVAEKNKLILDVVGYIDLQTSHHLMQENKIYQNQYQNHFKLGGYKIFIDGTPQGRTAWLTKPYQHTEDGYCGYPALKEEQVNAFVQLALEEKTQLLAHCNGDAAAEQYISSFEKQANNGAQTAEIRPVMVHAQLARTDQLPRMKALGIIPSYLVSHTFYWGDTHLDNLGADRAMEISPLQSTIENGMRYTLHHNTPEILPNMMEAVWCAVNRVSKGGVVMGEQQKITPLDALKGITSYAAYSYFEDLTKGSVKEGKNADLIILSGDPLTSEPITLKDIEVLKTYKDGYEVYSK